MKIILIIVIWILISFVLFMNWYNKPAYVQENNCSIEDLVNQEDIEKIEKAINKMGPYYQYIIETDGALKVKVDKQWLILKY